MVAGPDTIGSHAGYKAIRCHAQPDQRPWLAISDEYQLIRVGGVCAGMERWLGRAVVDRRASRTSFYQVLDRYLVDDDLPECPAMQQGS